MKALILSAGFGTRFQPLTQHIPKPAIAFLGLPVALYAVEYCLQMGVTEFFFNTHHLADRLREQLTPFLNRAGIRYQFIDEQPRILGSGGGLKNIASHLTGEEGLLVCNADELILPARLEDFVDFITAAKKSSAIASLLCMPHLEAGKRFGGVWCNSKNQVQEFGRKPSQDHAKVWHFLGLGYYRCQVLDYLPEGQEANILYDGIMTALAHGHQAQAHPIDCDWQEMGNEQEFLLAHDYVLKAWHQANREILHRCVQRFAPKVFAQKLLSCADPCQHSFSLNGESKENGNWCFVIEPSLKMEELPDCQRSILYRLPHSEIHDQILI